MVLAATWLYHVWSTSSSSKLDQTLRQAEQKLAVARDSLVQAQMQIDYMVQEISSSQRALRIISEQVRQAHLQHEAQRVADAQHRQLLEQRWQAEQKARRALQQMAQQYAIE
jgi:hypothetical protein